jgi:uncharacterized protein YgiM (DUF1202 family)
MKRKSITWMVAGLVLALSVSLIQAAEEFPFTGRVTGNNVNIRSGPDINYYTVAKLMQDNRVEVVGAEAEWYKISPPAGSFSWVDKAYVKKGEGDQGVITGGRVAIRAGSTVTDRKNYVQLLAGEGAKVTIVGQEGEWYKIAPPEGAYVWIAKDYVKSMAPKKVKEPTVRAEEEMGEEELEEQVGKEAPGEAKEAEAKVTLEALTTRPAKVKAVTTRPAEEIPTAFDKSVMGDFSAALAKADQQYEAEQKKSLADRKLDAIVEALKPIAEQKVNPEAASYAKTRLEVIGYQKESQEGLANLEEVQRQYAKEISRVQIPALKPFTEFDVCEAPFQGMGVLRPSLVFSGPLMPERYRLFDTEKCRTIAYVEIAVGVKINLSEYIGKRVAVYGTSSIDAKLGYRVIDAKSFKVIPETPAAIK